MKNLGDRMKGYEACYSFIIPARTYTVVRVDGRGFSKFTKGMDKPFDAQFSEAMNYATIELCRKFNPDFAYTQSDEISLVFTDFGPESQAMFGGKVQKICSLTAARATASFNKKMLMMDAENWEDTDEINYIINGSAIYDVEFDSRVFVIPDYVEVGNYFVWRQQDCTRNSISMAADALYSHKELHGKSASDKQDMMMEKGVNWNDYTPKYKRGALITREEFEMKSTEYEFDAQRSDGFYTRKKWVVNENTPIFTKERDFLMALIPSALGDK